jgi:aconitase B
MSPGRTVGLAIFAFSFASAIYAQETLKGEVATVDEASGKIGIKLSGTVGSGDTTGPTSFKVEDGLVFNKVKTSGQSFSCRRAYWRQADNKKTYKRIALWHFKQLVRYRPSARSGSIDERRFGVNQSPP